MDQTVAVPARLWRQFWAHLGSDGAAGFHLANELGVPDALDPQPALSILIVIDFLWYLYPPLESYGRLQKPLFVLKMLGVAARHPNLPGCRDCSSSCRNSVEDPEERCRWVGSRDFLPTLIHVDADPEVGRRQCAMPSFVGTDPAGIPHTAKNSRQLSTFYHRRPTRRVEMKTKNARPLTHGIS